MKIQYATYISIVISFLACQPVQANPSSAFGSGFDVQDFYKPFTLEEITPENLQKWPYYKYVSAHWDDYALHGTSKVNRSAIPAKLTIAEGDVRLNLNTEWTDGQPFIESLLATQVKGFVVMKDNKILAEYYDNGFMVNDTTLLQSASKTFAGVVTGMMVDQGLLDPKAKVESYLKDFKGTAVGAATVQQVLDMSTGLPTDTDWHTPGASGYMFEIEQGMKPGKPAGHRNTIKATAAESKPGERYDYNDKNTATLALLAEEVSGKKYPELLSEMFEAFGANYDGSIANSSDGTSAAAYGISITARDYALFHQWLAQGKGPKSFYASVLDKSKTKFSENETGKLLGGGITYGSQTYYLQEHNVLYSSGSYGELGYSDMQTGVSVIFLQDWAVNAELNKFFETRDRALAIINHLRAKSHSGRGF